MHIYTDEIQYASYLAHKMHIIYQKRQYLNNHFYKILTYKSANITINTVNSKFMKVNINLTSFFRDLFLVETESTLAFAVIGTIFARNASISYSYFFIPLLMGIFCMIPCIPVYLIENMTIPQVIGQRGAELIVLEFVCIWNAKLLAGEFLGKPGLCAVGACVLIFEALSYFTAYKMEKAETEHLNKRLKEKLKELEEASKTTQQSNIHETENKAEKIEVYGDHDNRTKLSLKDILYFEADAELVFAYTAKEIFQVKQRLYQVESFSRNAGIVRASKSYLVNLNKIQSVRTALNSRLYAKMPNGEEVLISRKYAPALKEALSC